MRRLDVGLADYTQNFVQYMMVSRWLTALGQMLSYEQNDMLGQVDNCHLAQADIKSPSHEDCMELAQIHSVSRIAHNFASAS